MAKIKNLRIWETLRSDSRITVRSSLFGLRTTVVYQPTGSVVDARNLVYYSNINAEDTKATAQQQELLRPLLPEGWNGIITPDPEGIYYVLISNFKGQKEANITGISIKDFAAPVFKEETSINGSKASVKLSLEQNCRSSSPAAT